jgi:hypothetical protein
MTRATSAVPARQDGFALIVALLSLVVLTFLGLTLAATTSSELQIATNYRRSQQALYNAEAGVEAGKVILQSVPGSWASVLPATRVGVTWVWDGTTNYAGTPAIPALPSGVPAVGTDVNGSPVRHWESTECDARGRGVGYGLVLSDANGLVQYRNTLFGVPLSGAVTVWVRRELRLNDDVNGTIQDESDDSQLVLTAEGVAPYSGASMSGGFGQTNAAVRTLEVQLIRSDLGTNFCENYGGQSGGAASSAGFAKCSTISGGATALAGFTDACRGDTGSASAGFGSGGAGGLGDTGVN